MALTCCCCPCAPIDLMLYLFDSMCCGCALGSIAFPFACIGITVGNIIGCFTISIEPIVSAISDLTNLLEQLPTENLPGIGLK